LALSALAVDELESVRVVLDELDELAGGDIKAEGGTLDVPIAMGEVVEGLGEKGGEIVVIGAADDAAGVVAGAPESGAGGLVDGGEAADDGRGAADVGGEEEAEAAEGDVFVLDLAAAFAGDGDGAGGFVGEGDLGFDLVAVLAAGAGGAAAREAALVQQGLVFKAGGVGVGTED